MLSLYTSIRLPSTLHTMSMSIYHPYRTLMLFVDCFFCYYFISFFAPTRCVALVVSCLIIPMVHQFDPRPHTSPILFRLPPCPPGGRWLFVLRFRFRSFVFYLSFLLLLLFRPFLICLSVCSYRIDSLLSTVLSFHRLVSSAKQTYVMY